MESLSSITTTVPTKRATWQQILPTLPKRNRIKLSGPPPSPPPLSTSKSGPVPARPPSSVASPSVIYNIPYSSAKPSPPSTSSASTTIQPDPRLPTNDIVASSSGTVAVSKKAKVNVSRIAIKRRVEEEAVKLWSLEKAGWVIPEHLGMNNGRPPIWSSSRQGLAEGLPYFKSYQGGHYFKAGRTHGYFLDGNPSPADVCAQNGRVIISHGGGSSERSPTGGSSFQLKESQSMSKANMAALHNCWKYAIPVVLLAGWNYLPFPWLKENGFRQAALGYYLVTHIWPSVELVDAKVSGQPQKQLVRLLVRFQWVGSQGLPWFDAIIGGRRWDNLPTSINHINSPLPALQTCQLCSKSFTPIYRATITCYNEMCPNFFRIGSGLADATNLRFTRSILGYAHSSASTLVPQQLLPSNIFDHALRASGYSGQHSLGSWKEAFHCFTCGRLNVRSEWNRLACPTPQCLSIDLVPLIYSMTELRMDEALLIGTPLEGKHSKRTIPRCDSSLSCAGVVIAGFTGWSIILPHGRGRIHQLIPDSLDEADDLFEGYQRAVTSNLFVRHALSTSPCAGPLLTNQFSFNSGVHYSFAANVKTISFADSPAPVLSCRNKLISAAQRIVQVPTDALFNEVMSVSYKSGGKMNYHNDGEEAVGPVIATQSLGSGTRMQFRERSSKASLKPGKKHHHSIVQLVLLHGDILIMEGDQFQAKYEHCIDPTSGLRFAATARKLASPS